MMKTWSGFSGWLMIIFLLASCQQEEGLIPSENDTTKETKDDSTYVDATLDFEIRDKNGKDLLSDEGGLSYDDIDVIYFHKGKEKIYDNPLALEGRKGYVICRDWDGKYLKTKYIHLYLTEPSKSSQKVAYTYLRIAGSKKLYTFKVEYDNGTDYRAKQKVYLDDVLFWPVQTGNTPVMVMDN